MAKKVLELDAPFRVGERVVAMRDVGPVPAGSGGRVIIANGLSTWIRYWVRFDDGTVVGHVDHDDLARPSQVEAWHRRQQEREAAVAAPEPSGAEPAAVGAGAPSGAASAIPEHLLERSRAAKARRLGA
jgi:hypothetical protein